MTRRTLRRRLSRSLSNTSGQGMTEYILIIALIAIATIGAVTAFGDRVQGLFGDATSALDGASESARNGSSGGGLTNFGR